MNEIQINFVLQFYKIRAFLDSIKFDHKEKFISFRSIYRRRQATHEGSSFIKKLNRDMMVLKLLHLVSMND